ncbi:MAG: RNA pseudouridine synthase [Desulfovibrio sp.]|nr:RNA pseudouridine synthase [Desulfovibrio sp.]
MAVRRDAGHLPGVFVVSEGPDYGAVFKPGGLSTASVGPGGGACLEDRLPGLFPGRRAILLGRLDRATSGIVAVAFDTGAAERFREAEDRGLVEKTYLAVVRGRISGPLTVENALDTARRKKTRVLDRPAEPLRRTRVAPLGYDAGTDLTLVRAVIMKGARHQIRAHLASLGRPILGDALYGRAQKEEGPLFLHHIRITFPGFTAVSSPDWATTRGRGSVLGLGPGVEQALDDVVLAYEVGP